MTITTRADYDTKIKDFDSKFFGFIILYLMAIQQPCIQYDSNSKGVNQKCLDSTWTTAAGCDMVSPYTVANQANKTYGQIVKDAYKYSNGSDENHPKTVCYKNPDLHTRSLTKPNVFELNHMQPIPGKKFVKNDNPIKSISSPEKCAENCTPQSNCISATYNSSKQKCWLNTGTYAEWKPPVKGSDNDTAITSVAYSMLYELEELNKELHDYEVKNNIKRSKIPSTGNLNKTVNTLPSKIYYFMTNQTPPSDKKDNTSSNGSRQKCTASTCSAAGDGSCKAPCGWNENNYCVCGGTGGSAPSTGEEKTTDDADLPPDSSVDPKDVALLKKELTDLKGDRKKTQTLLDDYKNKLTDLQASQADSYAALKKQLLTVVLIAVVGILLIILLSSIMQSFRSNDGMSGGGMKNCVSWPFKEIFKKLKIPGMSKK